MFAPAFSWAPFLNDNVVERIVSNVSVVESIVSNVSVSNGSLSSPLSVKFR